MKVLWESFQEILGMKKIKGTVILTTTLIHQTNDAPYITQVPSSPILSGVTATIRS